MDNEIKYIGFYDVDEYIHQNRNTFLAATNKMNYIALALVKSGYKVDIISPSWSGNKKGFYEGRKEFIAQSIRLIVGSTFGAQNRILRYFRIFWSWLFLFMFICFNTKKDEKVLVYHSIMLMKPIMLAQKFKKFKIILEVEEIYQDVAKFIEKTNKDELKFIESANRYIFPTELLNQKLNTTNKPYTIITGTYQVEDDRKDKYNDHNIHIIYAGTFDPRKGGALAAAAAAEYLSENYHLHIIGFGSQVDKKNLLLKIEEISKKTKATVTYDGLLSGEEYIRFIQKCQIGLSTQSPEAAYNETSFPSKILSYMANGLRVVSIRIKAIETSEIGNSVYYYEEPKPEEIAKAIMAIDLKEPYDSRELIRKLDKKFREKIKELLEN
ncbi:MAG: Uncharacterized protein FD141_84 [Fusobacteria bacterium]|nr:MAG: Uncharacterized protein FD141_84 [Fusobacteriota bacterium]KAF0229252.1 MAG: hypothetical protein FD182_1508 [Fusobacteriota bacterium]